MEPQSGFQFECLVIKLSGKSIAIPSEKKNVIKVQFKPFFLLSYS